MGGGCPFVRSYVLEGLSTFLQHSRGHVLVAESYPYGRAWATLGIVLLLREDVCHYRSCALVGGGVSL